MAYLGAGATFNGRIPANSILTITPWMGGSASFNYVGSSGPVTVSTATDFGPFPRDTFYQLIASGNGLDHFVRRAEVPAGGAGPVSAKPSDSLTTDQVSQVQGRLTPYLGIIATGCYSPIEISGAFKASSSRTAHYMRDSATQVKLVLANWASPAVAPEIANTAGTWTAAFENEAGLRAQVKWGGVTPYTDGGGETFVSDWCVLAIREGSKANCHYHLDNPTGIPVRRVTTSPTAVNTTFGNALQGTGTTTPDVTMSGNPSHTGGPLYAPPYAILAMTTKPSAIIIGDSIEAGTLDQTDVTGDIGGIARAWGAKYGYVNVSVASENAGNLQNLVTAGTVRRLGAAQWVTHAFLELGINDSVADGPALEARRAPIRAALKAINPNIKIFDVLLGPWNSSIKTALSVTRSGVVVTVTIPATGAAVPPLGSTVTIAGATPAAYNGDFTITAVTANTFTYSLGADPGADPTGTITFNDKFQTTGNQATVSGKNPLRAVINTYYRTTKVPNSDGVIDPYLDLETFTGSGVFKPGAAPLQYTEGLHYYRDGALLRARNVLAQIGL